MIRCDVLVDEYALFDEDKNDTANILALGDEGGTSNTSGLTLDVNDSTQSLTPKFRSLQDLYDCTEQVSLQDDVFYFAFFIGEDLVCFNEACREEKWKRAMEEEIKAIEKNQTWELTKLSSHKKPISVKWLYKTKINHDGSINKHKARLVVKGYREKEGEVYTEVFAPIFRLDTIRFLVSLDAQNNWNPLQMTVKFAFLNGSLQKEVYVEQPPSFVKEEEENKVYKLKETLYGLKQSL